MICHLGEIIECFAVIAKTYKTNKLLADQGL